MHRYKYIVVLEFTSEENMTKRHIKTMVNFEDWPDMKIDVTKEKIAGSEKSEKGLEEN